MTGFLEFPPGLARVMHEGLADIAQGFDMS